MADSKILGAGEITLVSDLKATDRLKYNTTITCETSGNHTFWASKGEESKFSAVSAGLSIDTGKPLLYINENIESANTENSNAWVMYPNAEFDKFHINDIDISNMTDEQISSALGNKKLYLTGTISNGYFQVIENDYNEIPSIYWYYVKPEGSPFPYGEGFPEHGTEKDMKSYISTHWNSFSANSSVTYPDVTSAEGVYVCYIYPSEEVTDYYRDNNISNLDTVHNGTYSFYYTYTNGQYQYADDLPMSSWPTYYKYNLNANGIANLTIKRSDEIVNYDWRFNSESSKIEYGYQSIYYVAETDTIEARYAPNYKDVYKREINLPFDKTPMSNFLQQVAAQNAIWTVNPNNSNFQYLLIGTIDSEGQYVTLDKDNYYFELTYDAPEDTPDDTPIPLYDYTINLIELMSYTYQEIGAAYIELSEANETLVNSLTDTVSYFNDTIVSVSGNIDNLRDELNSDVSSINLSIESLRLDLSSELDINIKGPLNELSGAINTYFKFNSDGLSIGKSDSPIFLKLEPDRITFINNNNVPMAWFSNDTLTVKDIVGQNSLQIGQFGFYEDEHHNVHLNWLGNTN